MLWVLLIYVIGYVLSMFVISIWGIYKNRGISNMSIKDKEELWSISFCASFLWPILLPFLLIVIAGVFVQKIILFISNFVVTKILKRKKCLDTDDSDSEEENHNDTKDVVKLKNRLELKNKELKEVKKELKNKQKELDTVKKDLNVEICKNKFNFIDV